MHKIGKIICCAVLCVPLIAAIVIGITGFEDNKQIKNPSVSADNDYLVKVKIHKEDGNLIREYDDPEVLQD